MHPFGEFALALAEQPTQRRQYRIGAGGEDEGVVGDHGAVGAADGPRRAVDPGDPAAQQPAVRGQRDHLRRVPPGQHLGEQHPVVRRVLLLADQQGGHAELTEPLGEPHAREAGADHHHTRIRGHAQQPAGRTLPGRITPVSRRERCPQRGTGRSVRDLGGQGGGR